MYNERIVYIHNLIAHIFIFTRAQTNIQIFGLIIVLHYSDTKSGNQLFFCCF